jgi:hypothetical protein
MSDTTVIPLSGENVAQPDRPSADASNRDRSDLGLAGGILIMRSYWSDFGWGATPSLRSRQGAGVDGRMLV